MRSVLLLLCMGLAAAETGPTGGDERCALALVADAAAVAPGQPVTVALRVELAPGWHIYWRNPGEAGLPTSIAWSAPDGWRVRELPWPAPEAFDMAGVHGYGYGGQTLFLAELHPPVDLAAASGPVAVGCAVEWLACREACIPGAAELRLELPVEATAAPGREAAAIAEARARLPREAVGWSCEHELADASLTLRLRPEASGAGDPGAVRFIPLDEGWLAPGGSHSAGAAGRAVLRLERTPGSEPPPRLRGLLLAEHGWDESGLVTAWILDRSWDTVP